MVRFIVLTFLFSCGPSEIELKRKTDILQEKYKKSQREMFVADSIKLWTPEYRKEQAKISKKKQKELEAKINKWKKSKAWKIQDKHPEWSGEACNLLANGRIWIGMSYDMLVYLRGKPNNVNTSNYGYGNEYQCCWYDYNPSCFYMKDDQIITAYN